jgi:Polyketide cyclase / dehydrase and lipid transport
MSWDFEYSVECPVDRDFAWNFWTDVNNWVVVEPSVDWVKLDGPFAAGTKGTTKPRNSDQVEWLIVEVQDRRRAVIDISVPGAVMRFDWRFEEITGGRTRITQRASLEGERAADYEAVARQMEEGMPQGMQKLADSIEQSA